jgi:hypothetical protein
MIGLSDSLAVTSPDQPNQMPPSASSASRSAAPIRRPAVAPVVGTPTRLETVIRRLKMLIPAFGQAHGRNDDADHRIGLREIAPQLTRSGRRLPTAGRHGCGATAALRTSSAPRRAADAVSASMYQKVQMLKAVVGMPKSSGTA